MRREALLHVSVLLIGFILKIIVAFYTYALVIEQVNVNCLPVLSPAKVICCDTYTSTVHEIAVRSSVTVRHNFMCDRQDSFFAGHNDLQVLKYQ